MQTMVVNVFGSINTITASDKECCSRHGKYRARYCKKTPWKHWFCNTSKKRSHPVTTLLFQKIVENVGVVHW